MCRLMLSDVYLVHLILGSANWNDVHDLDSDSLDFLHPRKRNGTCHTCSFVDCVHVLYFLSSRSGMSSFVGDT